MKTKTKIIAAILGLMGLLFLWVFGPAILVFIFLTFRSDWFPLFDDGPYRGIPRASMPISQPSQVFPIEEKWKLLVFPRDTGPAPTVALIDNTGATKWCVYAIAGNPKKNTEETSGTVRSSVRSLTFNKLATSGRRKASIRITGGVDWTYGNEGMSWYLNRNGDLYGYYYSW